MDIADIVRAIRDDKVLITDHADEEAQTDQLPFDEIFTSVLYGEIIEEYPDDSPHPSCLVYGNTSSNEPVHSVWAYNRETAWAVLITTYRPEPGRWTDWRIRRPTDEAV